MRQYHYYLLLLFFSGCATLGVFEYDKLYGEANVNNRLNADSMSTAQAKHFNDNIQPIIENRCVVCHGCYDAPCQLKLENRASLERGANKQKIYSGDRLLTAKTTPSLSTLEKLDAQQLTSLRSNGFFSVLNERQQTPLANKNAGLMYQVLKLKQQHPLPDEPLLNDSFDLTLDRNQQCPTIEEFPQYKANYPLGGMPYGLPGLEKIEYERLTNWLEKGALLPEVQSISSTEANIIAQWETWLNAKSNKQQLVSRYIYEHLYLANLFFEQSSQHYFKLVRSTTPPGEAVAIINSRRPYDAPPKASKDRENATPVYYRLLKNNDTIIAKRHMPYRFDLAKLTHLNELFIDPDYQVETLPNYQLKTASNPFITFKDLPAKARYIFMLEQAQFSIMNFIKGPVCRGQIALNVIEDHFWVFFADPRYIDHYHSDGFIDNNSDLLQLPASTSDKTLSLLYWHSYAKHQQDYLKNKTDFIKEIGFSQKDLSLDLIWSGDGNPNASLTVFRHFDSASVLQGFIGQTPKTAWLITYPLLERIHYLLVAGFDVYGNVGHQLKTRLYMDFLRMEAESNFVNLLPKKHRRNTLEYWYRDTSDTIENYLFPKEFEQLPETNIHYKTAQPQQELLQMIGQHTGNSTINGYNLKAQQHSRHYLLQGLQNKQSHGIAVLPQVSYIMVTGEQEDTFYTLINNSAHSNVAHLFAENERRLPEEDTLTLVAGIVGTYPNAFFQVTEQQIEHFVNDINTLSSASDYQQLKNNYGIRRTDKHFWQYADKLHAWYRANQADTAAILDFNRLENR